MKEEVQSKRPLICLVTGATTACGRAVALAYARQGARLVLAGASQQKQELERVSEPGQLEPVESAVTLPAPAVGDASAVPAGAACIASSAFR